MRIKAIIFDIAGPITTTEDPLIVKYYSDKYKLSFEKSLEIFGKYILPYEANKMTKNQFLKGFFAELKIPIDKNYYKRKLSYKKINKNALNLVMKLRKNYEVCYLSNECKDFWPLVEKKFSLNRHFDFGAVSYQYKVRKPHPKIFKAVLKKLKLKPDEVIFTDDSRKNADGAAKIGINSIHFKSLSQLKKELKKFNIKI